MRTWASSPEVAKAVGDRLLASGSVEEVRRSLSFRTRLVRGEPVEEPVWTVEVKTSEPKSAVRAIMEFHPHRKVEVEVFECEELQFEKGGNER